MTFDEHSKRVGKIVVNLQSLELVLRLFLLEEMKEDAQLPQPGDTMVPETWLTNYKSLSDLAHAYNTKLRKNEASRLTVDTAVVTVRDALAHGRLLSPTPAPPLTLFKFGKPKGGFVRVESMDKLTEAWLNEKIALTRDQILKVKECAEARGHKWLG